MLRRVLRFPVRRFCEGRERDHEPEPDDEEGDDGKKKKKNANIQYLRRSFRRKYTEEEVRAYQKEKVEVTQAQKFTDEDRTSILNYLKNKYVKSKMYDFMANVWRNKVISRQKRREQLLKNRSLYPPATPTHPKFVIHSPLYTDIRMNEDLVHNTFFVITFNGRQYKLLHDDIVLVSRMNGVKVGDKIEAEVVNLIGNKFFTILGRPTIPKAKVTLVVEEQTFAEKLIVFKKKRRKGYKKSMGFKHPYTRLKVEKLEFDVDEEMAARAISLI